MHSYYYKHSHIRIGRSLLGLLPLLLVVALSLPLGAGAALAELRLGPVAAMAVHFETDWPTVNLYAGGGLAIPGYVGSPLRNPSLNAGFRFYTARGAAIRPYLTAMYGWTLRTAGLQPFAGGGAGLAWRFGPAKAYKLSLEADVLLRDTWLPYPTAGFGLAVKL